MGSRTYYVYIIRCEKYYYNRRSKEDVFDKIVYYTGMTYEPKRRMREHKFGINSRWMMEHNIKPINFCYMESFNNPYTAHKRELQIKKFPLKTKLKLIQDYNA